jgi:RimJ/RimL family protein N-acetyltransferase
MQATLSATGDPGLRPADASDIGTLFQWRNDPWIVSVSTSGREVTWEEHTSWFASVLDQSHHLLFIIQTDEGTPAGSLRLDRKGADAIISIYLMQPYTGMGLGPRAIDLGSRRAFEHWPMLERVIALIRVENRRSVAAFTRVSFRPAEDEVSCPEAHVAMVRERDES